MGTAASAHPKVGVIHSLSSSISLKVGLNNLSRGSGERNKLPQRGPGRNAFYAFSCSKMYLVAVILLFIFEISMRKNVPLSKKWENVVRFRRKLQPGNVSGSDVSGRPTTDSVGGQGVAIVACQQ